MPDQNSAHSTPHWDHAAETLLRETPNFGPVTLAEWASMGIHTLDQIDALGVEAAMQRWIAAFPNRLNANAALGLITALEGLVWTQASPEHRARARQLIAALKQKQKGRTPR